MMRLMLHGPASFLGTGRRKLLAPVRASMANELWYKVELLRLVRQMHRETVTTLSPVLKQLTARDGLTTDAQSLEAALAALMKKFNANTVDKLASRLAFTAVKKNLKTVDKTLAQSIKDRIGVDVTKALLSTGPIANSIREATRANVALIKTIPEQYFARIQKEVYANLTSGNRYESLIAKIQYIGSVTESRAKLIARDQTSKLNSEFNRVRQQSVGIERYRWQTAGDERVRETHAENDGKIFRWDDPPAETGNPGDDIQCRCVAIPIVEGL